MQLFHLRRAPTLAQPEVGQEPRTHPLWNLLNLGKTSSILFFHCFFGRKWLILVPWGSQAFHFVLTGALETGKWGALRPALSFLHTWGLGVVTAWPLRALWAGATQAERSCSAPWDGCCCISSWEKWKRFLECSIAVGEHSFSCEAYVTTSD